MSSTLQSEVGPLQRVLLKHPRDAWTSDDSIEAQWRVLGYRDRPDLARGAEEFDALADLLRGREIEVALAPRSADTGLDSIYVRDAAVVCDRGAILCRMGKPAREGEPAALEAPLASAGLQVIGRIEAPGTIEGGDVLWLDRRTVAVGRGYRTNAEGIWQLRSLLGGGIDVLEVPLPHWRGPTDVFHLMSIVSPLDHDLALVYSPLMPVPFRETLADRGIQLVEVPEEEFDDMAGNVLALAPRVCLQLSGCERTRRRLEDAGVEVLTYVGAEISGKGCGGPTCLTRTLERGS